MSDGRVVIDSILDTRQSDRGVRNLQRSLDGLNTNTYNDRLRLMSAEMKRAFQESRAALVPFKRQLLETEFSFFKLSRSMGSYTGTNKQFMAAVHRLGNEHKKATENMMKNNDMMKASFIQTVGTMLARSGQSEKIAANFERMGNPLYTVNNGLLRVTSGLERMARQGNAAVLALKMLGPNANMKELNDMTRMINQGLMRYTSVALAASAASIALYGGLHEAAMDNKAYAESFNTMVSTLQKAMQPLVDVFTMVMPYVYNFITQIAQMIVKFNEAHPVISKVIAGFVLLLPALTALLSPLSIGIGAINGWRAAFSAVWMLIGPLVTGLGAMTGTVALVAAAIVGVTTALVLLWNKTSWFKGMVIGAWTAIQTATQTAWNWIMNNIIMPVMTAIQTFVQEKLAVIKQFWDQNGTQIMQAAQNVWNVISTVVQTAMNVISTIMQTVWPVVKEIVVGTWNAIQNVVNGAINIVLGIIKTFSSLFTGDWKGVWEGAKQIIKGALELIWGWVQLFGIGRLVKFFGGLIGKLLSPVKTMWSKISSVFSSTLGKIWGWVSSKFNSIVSTISNAMNKAKSFISNIWNGIKSFFGTILGGIWNVIKSIFTKITSTVNSATSAVRGVISRIWNGIKTFFSNTVVKIWTTVKDKFQRLVDSVGDKMNAARDKIKSIWDKVMGFFRGINLFKIGKDIIQGLINGIGSLAGAVWKKAGDIANGITNKFKSLLGIHSPSRVMTELGEFTGEGAEIGLDKSVRGISKAAERIAQAAVPDLPDLKTVTSNIFKVPSMQPAQSDTAGIMGAIQSLANAVLNQPVEVAMPDINIPLNINGQRFATATNKDMTKAQRRQSYRDKRRYK
ncbi:hypothetical protein FKN04_22355 [Bacillus glycinifermentans]|uniref:phage tail protein n=1 Tax=Bacillus glycinifermentans TaxID=1664069 RepID=UPI0015821079|nr:hypothetical protein [Bacillus glycinifermentans]NUJ19278.1 hypothetical protein [Bacillus glycinifermentans]